MRAASERPALLGGGLGLHLENPFDDLIDAGFLRFEVSFVVAEGYPEPPGHGQHGELLAEARKRSMPIVQRPAMSLMAVMLGRKQ